jgi:GNAT superfamily N-acetyltransferase
MGVTIPSLTVRELTPDLWPAFEDLFDTSGPVGRCWCMYWRIGAEYRKRPPERNRSDFHDIVETGPPPGLLAFDGDTAVGWCQLTPRSDLPHIDRDWRLRPADSTPVWSISCFYVRKDYRRKGVSRVLIDAAIETARRAGVPALEAYPVDSEVSVSSTHTGYASTFEKAGFETVARHVDPRPIMRYVLER